MTNELVRQLLEQDGMYGLEKPIGDMKSIVDTRYVAAMDTPGVCAALLLQPVRPCPQQCRWCLRAGSVARKMTHPTTGLICVEASPGVAQDNPG